MDGQPSQRTWTVFRKVMKTSIDAVRPGDVVYIKMRNPQHFGIRELEYYGRITKITSC